MQRESPLRLPRARRRLTSLRLHQPSRKGPRRCSRGSFQGAGPRPASGVSPQRQVSLESSADKIFLPRSSGLTETSPVTHILQLDDARSHPGSVGRLIPNTEARLIDDDGRDATSTEGVWPEGEMWFRGPNVMK